jgi:hypothetical protein
MRMGVVAISIKVPDSQLSELVELNVQFVFPEN